jgi:uncharacterized protein YllA (UPF0747 family)
MSAKLDRWMPFEQGAVQTEDLLQQLRATRDHLKLGLGAQLGERLKLLHKQPLALEHLKQLVCGQAVGVITGQQPCLWAGPSLVLHKILTVLSICRWLRKHGIQAVPIYWNASEDHDLKEMLQVAWSGEDLKWGNEKLNFGEARSAESFEPLSLEGSALPMGSWLRSCWRAETASQGSDYGSQSSEFFRCAFASQGLVVLEPRDLATVQWDFWAKVNDRKAELKEAFDRDERERLGLDLPLQAPRRHPLPLFQLDRQSGQRKPFGDDVLGRNLLDLPEHCRLSPGALLRPVGASAVLPLLVSVLGPAEMKYHHQVHGAFGALGVQRPLLWPRLSGSWLPQALADELADLGVEPASMIEEPSPHWSQASPSLIALGEQLRRAHADVALRFPGHSGGLEQFERDLSKAWGRLQRNGKRLNMLERGLSPRRWRLIQDFFLPRGAKQERRLAWTSFVEDGPHLDRILGHFQDPLDFEHRFYT